MGRKKIWRIIDKMVINGVRAAMPIVNATPEQCKFCGSKNIVRYGHYRMVQRWWCKDCKRKFVYNDALPKMRTPIIQVASALSMFYEGMSLHGIRRNFEQTYRNYPSNSTIYEWVVRFTKLATKTAKDYKPEVGDVWVADETVLKVGGRKIWFFDVVDEKTRYLLASKLAESRTIKAAASVMNEARRKAGKSPKKIITDGLTAYIDGIELVFGGSAKHIQSKPFTDINSTNVIERFHGTLKARTKVMRGLKKEETAKLITDGWLIHYNFFRPHEALKDKTPAEKAGIKFPFRNWLDIVKGGGL
jgi:putative transposase